MPASRVKARLQSLSCVLISSGNFADQNCAATGPKNRVLRLEMFLGRRKISQEFVLTRNISQLWRGQLCALAAPKTVAMRTKRPYYPARRNRPHDRTGSI